MAKRTPWKGTHPQPEYKWVFPPPSQINEEGSHRVSHILIAGILFPAIPLAMNNVSGRYRAVAGLIRNLQDTMEQPDLSATKHSIFMAELVSLKRRTHLIKASQFFGGLAFVFNLLFVLATYLSRRDHNPFAVPRCHHLDGGIDEPVRHGNLSIDGSAEDPYRRC